MKRGSDKDHDLGTSISGGAGGVSSSKAVQSVPPVAPQDAADDQVNDLAAKQKQLRRRTSTKLELLQEFLNMAGKTAKELRDLLAQERTVDGGILVLLRDLKAKVDAAKGDQVEIDAAFAETQSDMAAKAQAIIDNTPSA
jgi:hypothetical protein